jgi:hypothetical protein
MTSISIGLSSGTNREERLACGHDLPDGCHGQLLNGARDRRPQLDALVLGPGLDQLLLQTVRPAFGVGELLHLIGDELGGHLLDLALERGHRCDGFGELAALADLSRHVGLVLLQRVDHQGARQGPLLDERLAHIGTLPGQRQQLLARSDTGAQTVTRCGALGMLGRQARPVGGKLRQIGGEHTFLALANGLAGRIGKRDGERFQAISGCRSNSHTAAGRLGSGRFQLPRQCVAVGAGLGGIELHKHVAGRHAAAVLDGNGDNLAGLEWLHDLGAAARLDATVSDGVNIEPAAIGPRQRGGKGGADQPDGDHPDRRRRRLQELQCCGQEFPVHRVHPARQRRGGGSRRACCV